MEQSDERWMCDKVESRAAFGGHMLECNESKHLQADSAVGLREPTF